jgi:class 3 adenylate cyclase
MPLINRDGFALGTLCVWDPESKAMDVGQQDAFRRLARLVMDKLERRRDVLELRAVLQDQETRLSQAETAMTRAEEAAYRLLPSAMAVRVLSKAEVTPKVHERATVLVAELMDVADRADGLNGASLVATLNAFVACCEAAARAQGLEMVGMWGGSYMAVASGPRPTTDPAVCAATAALEVRKAAAEAGWPVRVAVHSGPVISGMVGDKRLSNGLWGDGVTTALEMLEVAVAGAAVVSNPTQVKIAAHFKTRRGPDSSAGPIHQILGMAGA